MAVPDHNLLMGCYDTALKTFCENDIQLIATVAHEQAMAHRIAMYLEQACREQAGSIDPRYVVDCEYNRNGYGIKEIINDQAELIEIRADVILHSRGLVEKQDNLIAIELKIVPSTPAVLEKDRVRLKAMTTPVSARDMKWGGGVLPEAVCGYKLGVYVLINSDIGLVDQEFFVDGKAHGSGTQLDLRAQVSDARIANLGIPEVVRRKRARWKHDG